MKVLLVPLSLLALADPVAAADAALQPLIQRLEQARVVQADYVQTKTLQALKRPLVSRGRIVFIRDRGVLWRIEQPYQAAYVLGSDSVTEVTGDGRKKTRPLREVPVLAQIGTVFRAIFQGDTQALEGYFDIAPNSQAGRWHIELSPKPQLARFLKSIDARGGEFLEHLEIIETSGDRSQIDFEHSKINAQIDPADQALFGD